MTEYSFYITTDQIDGLRRLADRFGDSMSELVVQQWFIDHGIIPSKDVQWTDGFVRTDSGIILKARKFHQSHNFFKMY